MKSFKLSSNWNGDGIRLFLFRKFLEMREFDLRKGNVIIEIDEEGMWNFSNPEKPQIKKGEPVIIESELEEIPIPPEEEFGSTGLDSQKPKKEKPLCKKCGEKHWPMHKCLIEKEK